MRGTCPRIVRNASSFGQNPAGGSARAASYATSIGVRTYEFVRRKKHPAVVITLNGKKYIHCFPGTPSDHRSAMNCISDLRRRLGLCVTGKLKAANCNKKPKRSKKRRLEYRLVAGSQSPTAPAREDKFYAPLAALKMKMLADRAPENDNDGPESISSESRP